MGQLPIVHSLSGGMSSATVAALTPADRLVFALVRTSNPKCKFKDKALAKRVEDKLQKPFVGTLEDDSIIYTMFDLEQHLGQSIDWVTGVTFEQLVGGKKGLLPTKLRRFCTIDLKIIPIAYWWAKTYGIEQPVQMGIGYRAGEEKRASKMLTRVANGGGFDKVKLTFEKHKSGYHKGKNKWLKLGWRVPFFPLIEAGYTKADVVNFWKDKNVRFAKLNNCIGCFHRSPALLKKMSELYPEKFNVFVEAETLGKGTFKKNLLYSKIPSLNFTASLFEAEGCNSGFCGF